MSIVSSLSLKALNNADSAEVVPLSGTLTKILFVLTPSSHSSISASSNSSDIYKVQKSKQYSY